MTIQRASRLCLVASLLALGAACGLGTAVAAQPVTDDGPEGMQVLTRGPVHEAFAETVTFDPEPGIVVARAPPAAIEELPPEHKPEGDNVAWIPGYWAWDDDGDDFLWVSGTWRALPPGRQWVSGYWGETAQGVQWVSGYWADARLTEAAYLPEPPESAEAGPNIAAPSADHIWLPGGWVWQQNRYAWQPGFWSEVQPNWVWIPAHYLWAPRGYVYVDGYWDYAVDRRGVLFAPVSFSHRLYSQQGFSYTPSTVIDLGVFASHLFLRPNYGHYYYGDYYGANYAAAGFYPSYSFNSRRHGYDPIYAHQRWDHRQDRDWERRIQADFQHRRDNENARPPRTFAAQQELGRKGLTRQDKGRVFAQPLDQIAKAKDSPVRFQPVNNDDRRRFGRLGREARTHREERQKLEAKAVDPADERPGRAFEPARVNLSRSPFVAKGADQFGNDQAPPKTHELPQPDPKVVPKPRQPIGQVQRLQREPKPLRSTLQPKPEPQVSPIQTPKVDLKPVPRVNPPQPKVERQPIPPNGGLDQPRPARPNLQPKPEPRVNPTQTPKVTPKPVPRVDAIQQPKVELKPVPRVNPTPPKVQPKPEPRVNPVQTPKVAPKTTPRLAPTLNPRANPPPPKVGSQPTPPKSKDR